MRHELAEMVRLARRMLASVLAPDTPQGESLDIE